LLVLISCSACFWCGRGVKNVTKLVANTAIEGGVMAADFYLMGAAGQFMENRKAADQERERQILAKEDEMVHKAIDDALKKKRQKKVKE
uniref:Uncharacterized protein n=1 Tax=Romanomermis culicivorax TaxID=13658 RepID=A0A915JXB3_ROMCU